MVKRTAVGLVLAWILSGCSAPAQQQQVNAQYAFSSSPFSSSPSRGIANRDGVNLLPQAPRIMRDFQPVSASPALIREALLDEHQRWVGTPYVLGGTTQRGVDCSGLMQNIFTEAFSLDLPRTADEQAMEGSRVNREGLKAGDLVFFRPPGSSHVGVYVGDGYFLHASTSQGVKLSRLDNVYWGRYYWQARRPMERTQLAQRIALAGNS